MNDVGECGGAASCASLARSDLCREASRILDATWILEGCCERWMRAGLTLCVGRSRGVWGDIFRYLGEEIVLSEIIRKAALNIPQQGLLRFEIATLYEPQK